MHHHEHFYHYNIYNQVGVFTLSSTIQTTVTYALINVEHTVVEHVVYFFILCNLHLTISMGSLLSRTIVAWQNMVRGSSRVGTGQTVGQLWWWQSVMDRRG
jgi:hypothetical protein